jgi:hypothetical protein
MWHLLVWIMPIKQLIYIIKKVFNTGSAEHGFSEEIIFRRLKQYIRRDR